MKVHSPHWRCIELEGDKQGQGGGSARGDMFLQGKLDKENFVESRMPGGGELFRGTDLQLRHSRQSPLPNTEYFYPVDLGQTASRRPSSHPSVQLSVSWGSSLGNGPVPTSAESDQVTREAGWCWHEIGKLPTALARHPGWKSLLPNPFQG